MGDIDARKPDGVSRMSFKVNRHPKDVRAPEHLFRQLRAYEELFSKSTDFLPYRHQIQLNAITEALTIIRGNHEIGQEDIDAVSQLSNWINYIFNEI